MQEMRYSVGTFIEKERSSVDKTPMELFQEQLGINKAQVAVEVVRLSHDKQKEAVREAFRHTVKANSRYLPSHLVAVRSDGGYTMMDYLGTKGGEQSFYHCTTGIYVTQDPVSDSTVPVVACVENLSRDDMMAILGLMDSLMTSASIPRLIIPTGFFVFSFAARKSHAPKTKYEKVVQAESLDEAFRTLLGIFSRMRESSFESIMVTTGEDSRWVKIFDEEVSRREVQTIVGPPRYHRLSIE